MKYDKIRGKSVAECMMKLRSAYGSQAVILSTREVKEGGLLGSGLFSRKLYEIDFMLPEDGTSSSSRSLISPRGRDARNASLRRTLLDAVDAAADRKRGSEQEASPERGSAKDGEGREKSGDRAGDSRPALADQPAGEIPPLPSSFPAPPAAKPEPEVAALPAGFEPPSASERAALDMLLAEDDPEDALVRREKRRSSFPDTPAAEAVPPWRAAPEEAPPRSAAASEGRDGEQFARTLYRIRDRLLSAQLSREFADRFLMRVDDSLSKVEKSRYRNVESRSLEALSEMIRTVPDIAPPRGECRAVMLIGPTGSGKTTSLAKLAAKYHLMESREVSIYSLDHYRLAATEQLKTYAGVMDVPFFAPFSPAEFAECMRRDGAELMLIDTSGIGHRDTERLEQLYEYVEACEVRLEKHLVLAANTNGALLEKILLAYDRIGFDKIILTKLDESDFVGAFIEVADKYNRPFSFLMNGQDVPGSIVAASSMELARMVLREEQGATSVGTNIS